MGLRNDVIHELSALDTSSRALRRFGLLVGGAFALLTALGVWRDWPPPVLICLGAPAVLLISLGAAAPAGLKSVHRGWMSFALALGWCMSRLILALVFGLAVVPLAVLGRLFRLPFTKIRHALPRESYWVDHPSRTRQHHTDMF